MKKEQEVIKNNKKEVKAEVSPVEMVNKLVQKAKVALQEYMKLNQEQKQSSQAQVSHFFKKERLTYGRIN